MRVIDSSRPVGRAKYFSLQWSSKRTEAVIGGNSTKVGSILSGGLGGFGWFGGFGGSGESGGLVSSVVIADGRL